MVPQETSDSAEVDAELEAALERIGAADSTDIEDQVDQEILRYWNERVNEAEGDDSDQIRRLRAAIAQLLFGK